MARKIVAVPEQLLIQRINSKLSAKAEHLKSARSFRMETSVGRYFIIDVKQNCITRQHVDLEELGRDLGVLADWEVSVFVRTISPMAGRRKLRRPANPSVACVQFGAVPREVLRAIPSPEPQQNWPLYYEMDWPNSEAEPPRQ